MAGVGESITGLAARLVAQYDRSGDGVIDLSRSDELMRIDRHDDGGSAHYAQVSGRRLFTAADRAGNGDGKVTRDELVALGKRYDTGGWFGINAGDGALDGVEMLRAMGEVGEEIVGFVGASKAPNGDGGSFLAANQQGGLFVAGGSRGAVVLGGNQQGGFGLLGDLQRGIAALRDGSTWKNFHWG